MSKSPNTANKMLLSMPPSGWESFVKSFWEKHPQHFRRPFSVPFATADEIFKILVKAGEGFQGKVPLQNKQREGIRFYIENCVLATSVGGHLPVATDNSLSGYCARVSRLTGHRDFTLVVNNAQSFNSELWQRVRSFVTGLCDIVGTPLRSDVVLYLSRSRTTAFGAHQDPYGNFLFQICGQKRFRLWSNEIFQNRPEFIGSINCDEILDKATTFTVREGDLLYMPSGYYHLGESGDDLSVHVSVVLSADMSRVSRFVQRLAHDIVKKQLGESGIPPFFTSGTAMRDEASPNVPAHLEPIINAYTNLDQAGLRRSVSAELMRLSTSLGCELPPPLLSYPPLLEQDYVQAVAGSPITYMVWETELHFAANGRGYVCPAHPKLVGLLQYLRQGNKCRVGDLITEYCGVAVDAAIEIEVTVEDIKFLLEKLCDIGAIIPFPYRGRSAE